MKLAAAIALALFAWSATASLLVVHVIGEPTAHLWAFISEAVSH